MNALGPEQFIVYLCQPKRTIKKILVSTKATVKELSLLFPNQKKCFIFRGAILSESYKLEMYGIKNMDHIVVINDEEKDRFSSETNVWLNATKDQADFNDRMFLSTNCSTRIEAARLKDLKMSKLELKRKSFTKIVSRVNADFATGSQSNVKIGKTIVPCSIEPSSEPLPMFWFPPKRAPFKIMRGISEPEIMGDSSIDVR